MINSTLRHVKKVCLIIIQKCICMWLLRHIFDILLNCRITEMHLQNREILESYSELIKVQYTFWRRILHECLMNNVNRFSGFQLLKRKLWKQKVRLTSFCGRTFACPIEFHEYMLQYVSLYGSKKFLIVYKIKKTLTNFSLVSAAIRKLSNRYLKKKLLWFWGNIQRKAL